MNKKLNLVLGLSILALAVPAQAITHYTAAGLTALSLPVYYFALKLGIIPGMVEGEDSGFNYQQEAIAIKWGSALGAPALTAGTYWAFYQFTPSGRYKRANKKVQNLKDDYPRVFGDIAANNFEQILHDLGAFTKTYKGSRNFVYLNALQELDYATKQLKKAESLLIAAKKDICPEPFEWCEVKARRLYARIKKTSPEQIEDPKNHLELAAKIDVLLAEVQVMLNKVTSIYSYIELHGSDEFKQQLKDYEKLQFMRSQNTRSAVINFAIPTAAIAGSLAAVMLATGGAYSLIKRQGQGGYAGIDARY